MSVDVTPAQPRPAQVQPSAVPGLRGLLTLAIGVVVVAALYFGHAVFVPLVLAVLLSFVLGPVVNLLRRMRLGRAPSVVVAVLLVLAVIGGVGAVIGTQVADVARDLPRYQSTVEAKFAGLQHGWLGEAGRMLRRFNNNVHDAAQTADAAGAGATATSGGGGSKAQLVRVEEPAPSPLALAEKVIGPIVEPFTTVGIVLVVVVFLLMQREDLRKNVIRLFGSRDLHRTTMVMDDAARRLGTYFLAQLGMNAAFGVIVAIGLSVIGVPDPLLWGVFSTLMRFIPYVGSILSGILPGALAAAVDPGWSMVAATAALYLITEPIFGQVIEPLLYGHSTGLSPFAVIVSTLFWGFLWGPIGLILATPFTVCLVVLGRHVDSLEFLDVLLGDRPPLTPVENFYQRMLAGDPDEARDLGEAMLKERSLSSYYDEVALKGLQLAANDHARGVVTPAQLDGIRAAASALLEDFADRADVAPTPKGWPGDLNPTDTPTLAERAHPTTEAVPARAPVRDARPPAWQGTLPVLCVSGRGPLDEVASAILAQLLGKHGLGARVLPHNASTREGVRDLDVAGVAMICVVYLDISGNPSHLRYLLERLRRHAPGVPILVGMWPVGDRVLTDAAFGREIGADAYASSLRSAVETCREAAGGEHNGIILIAE